MRSRGSRGVACGSGGGGTDDGATDGITPGGGLLVLLWLPATGELEEAPEVTILSEALEVTIPS